MVLQIAAGVILGLVGFCAIGAIVALLLDK